MVQWWLAINFFYCSEYGACAQSLAVYFPLTDIVLQQVAQQTTHQPTIGCHAPGAGLYHTGAVSTTNKIPIQVSADEPDYHPAYCDTMFFEEVSHIANVRPYTTGECNKGYTVCDGIIIANAIP